MSTTRTSRMTRDDAEALRDHANKAVMIGTTYVVELADDYLALLDERDALAVEVGQLRRDNYKLATTLYNIWYTVDNLMPTTAATPAPDEPPR